MPDEHCSATRAVWIDTPTPDSKPDTVYDCVLPAGHHEKWIDAGEYVDGDVHVTADGIRWR